MTAQSHDKRAPPKRQTLSESDISVRRTPTASALQGGKPPAAPAGADVDTGAAGGVRSKPRGNAPARPAEADVD